MLGLGIAPPVVGWLNDLGRDSYGAEAIRYSLAAILLVHALAAFHLLRAAGSLAGDLTAAERLPEEPR